MKIIAPNKNYTGISAGVAFANGVGDCSNPDTINWFEQHGYDIKESLDNDETSISEKEFKALKKENAELKKSADPKELEKNKALKDKLKAVEKELEELKKADE